MFHARLLRYLDEVERCGSIRKAGDRLHVAASAINRQIIALEQDLGTPLFRRLPSGLVATSAGEVLIGHARETLRAMDRARLQIEEIKGLKRGEVSIAVISGLASTILPLAMPLFRKTHPQVRFRVMLLTKAEIAEQVADGEADLGLGFNLEADDRLKVFASVPSRLGIVVGAKHPMASSKSPRFTDCLQYPICLADPANAIRAHVDRAAAECGVAFDPDIETNSVEVMRRMARDEGCLTFLSAFDIYPELVSGELIYLPLEGTRFAEEQVTLVGPRRSSNVLAEGMIDIVSQLLHDCASAAK